MNRFPFLSSLARKNEHCMQFFRRSCKGPNFSTGKGETPNLEINPGGKFIHWKKRYRTRFENDSMGAATVDSTIMSKNWAFTMHSEIDHTTSTDCPLCDKPFPSRRLLNHHKSSVHFPPYGSEKEFCYLPFFGEPKKFDQSKRQSCPLECPLCKKWFSGMKTGSVDTYLEGLKKKAKEKEELSRPGRKGKGLTKRRVCELCSKILSNRKGLERHMLIHTGDKPFPCDICLKKFRRKDNCARHKKTAHLFKKPRKPRQRRSQLPTAFSADAADADSAVAALLGFVN